MEINVECAHCGNRELMQVPGTWTPMPIGDQGVFQGPVVPVVMLGCPQCGFVQLFSPQAIVPQPFPDMPPGAEAPPPAGV